MGKLICLLGKSGSGKSTLEKRLARRLLLNRVISTTTRPMRDGEKNGNDYVFISQEEYNLKLHNGEFIAPISNYTHDGKVRSYSIDVKDIDLSKGNYICVVEPNGHKDLIEKLGKENVISIMINVSDKIRVMRSIMREDNPNVKEICKRVLEDSIDYQDVYLECDFIVANGDLEETEDDIIDFLAKAVKR